MLLSALLALALQAPPDKPAPPQGTQEAAKPPAPPPATEPRPVPLRPLSFFSERKVCLRLG